MKKVLLFGALALTVAFASCNNKQTKTEATVNDSVAVAVTDTVAPSYLGEYEGTIPCADCPGIKVNLKLDDDTTYNLKEEYLEKKDGKMEYTGNYTVENDLITLIRPSTNEKTYYKIQANAVEMCDSTGKVAEGATAGKYTLTKK